MHALSPHACRDAVGEEGKAHGIALVSTFVSSVKFICMRGWFLCFFYFIVLLVGTELQLFGSTEFFSL